MRKVFLPFIGFHSNKLEKKKTMKVLMTRFGDLAGDTCTVPQASNPTEYCTTVSRVSKRSKGSTFITYRA